MHGILLIDKPEGLTSAEVVRRVKRGLTVKVGHLGTLDPFATGLLPLCLGEATKIAQFLNTADKRYEGVIQLGRATDTGDRTGATTRTAAVPRLTATALAGVARHFTGEHWQLPPMYSALKRDGIPLYRLARRGVEVERERRAVRIETLQLEPHGSDQIRFAVACSKGTYVRVLAEEIGAALGSAAHLHALRRTRFGSFELAGAVPLAEWNPRVPAGLVSIRQALASLPAVRVSGPAAAAARQGKASVLAMLGPQIEADTALLIDPAGAVVAVVVRQGHGWSYGRVLSPGQPLQRSDAMLRNEVK